MASEPWIMTWPSQLFCAFMVPYSSLASHAFLLWIQHYLWHREQCYKSFRILFGNFWNGRIILKLTDYLEFDSLICYYLKKINRNFPERVKWVQFSWKILLKIDGSSMFFVCLKWLFKMSLLNEWEGVNEKLHTT